MWQRYKYHALEIISELKHTHSSVGKFINRSMRINTEYVRASSVHAAEDECSPNVSLITKQHTLEQRGGGLYRHCATSMQPLQLQLRRHRLSRHLRVGSCSRTAAVHIRRQIMNFLTVLVRYYSVFGGSRIGAEDDTVSINNAYDGCSCLNSFWRWKSFMLEECIAVNNSFIG